LVKNFTKEQSVAWRGGQTKKLPLDFKGITADYLEPMFIHMSEKVLFQAWKIGTEEWKHCRAVT